MIGLALCLFAMLLASVAQAETPLVRSPEGEVVRLIDGALPEGAERDRRYQQFLQDFAASERGVIPRKRVYDAHMEALGVRGIVDFLEGQDPHCHGVAHSLGASIGERARSLADGMAVCGTACTYACVHGVFKTYFTKNAPAGFEDPAAASADTASAVPPSVEHDGHAHHDHAPVAPDSELFKQFTADAVATCREDSVVVPGFYRGNCAHAVGHAFATIAPTVKEANEYCGAFPGREMQYYCETGVFMERDQHVEAEVFVGEMSPAERRARAIAYCNANSRSPGACLRFVLTRNQSLADVDAFAAECGKLTGATQRRGCFNALGFFSRTFSVEAPHQLAAICRHGDAIDQQVCITGVVLVKKGHRHESALVKGCNTLKQPDLADLCRDQSARSYYQPGNPVMALMLGAAP